MEWVVSKQLFLVFNDIGFLLPRILSQKTGNCQEFCDSKLEIPEISQFILMYCEMLPCGVAPFTYILTSFIRPPELLEEEASSSLVVRRRSCVVVLM